ncbi:hypothetical protein FRB93_004600 [Tulasnella sp. JGI-2019a]|nr:hypothetical protein FRB93_004600 [Tulasnella sp. JGI-2019a]
MLTTLVISKICSRIAAQVTVGTQDPQLIYTLAGGVVVNNNMGRWTASNSPFSDKCGGVIGTGLAGNSVTLIFNGTYVSATLLLAQDSSQSVQLLVDGAAINPINTQDGSLPTTDFATCAPITTSSGTLTAGTHNATLVQLENHGWMFFHNFIYTPIPVTVSATSTVTTAVGPSTTLNPASAASTTGGAVATGSSSHSSVGPIVGGVLGGLVIAILAGLCLWRHRRQQREGDDNLHENNGAAIYRGSSEEQEYKETSPSAQQRSFSFGRSQSIANAQHVDMEGLPDHQIVAATTTMQTPSIASELPQHRALPALPPSPSPANPNQLEIIERLINQNVPRQDITAIIRTMAAAGPSGSGAEVSGDQQRAGAIQRQPDTHTSETGIEMLRQGQEQHPPMYDFKDGRQT